MIVITIQLVIEVITELNINYYQNIGILLPVKRMYPAYFHYWRLFSRDFTSLGQLSP